MSESASTRETVFVDQAVHDIYKKLTEAGDPLAAPFREMKDVFLWAACLGHRRGKSYRRPLEKKVLVFRWAQFDKQVDVPIIKALGIAETSDVAVLQSRDDLLTIVEEYANGGIHELWTVMQEEGGRPLLKLVDHVNGLVAADAG